MSELEACPFCGSTEIDPKGWVNDIGDSGPECMKCGATGSNIANWNTRPSAPQWISVETELPEEEVSVLACMPNARAIIAVWDGLHWGDPEDEYPGGYYITHWMPLPSAPEEVKA